MKRCLVKVYSAVIFLMRSRLFLFMAVKLMVPAAQPLNLWIAVIDYWSVDSEEDGSSSGRDRR